MVILHTKLLCKIFAIFANTLTGGIYTMDDLWYSMKYILEVTGLLLYPYWLLYWTP